MAVELEGLEFQIEAVSTEAIQGINALTASLSRLKSAVKGDGFSVISKGIASIGKAAETLRPEKLEGLTKALSDLSGIKISGSVSKNLAAIGTALGPLAESGESAISRLEALPKALSAIGNVKISSTLPKRLTELGTAMNTLAAGPGGEQLAGLATGLAGLSTARITGSIPQRLEAIGASLDRLTPEGVSCLERVSRALRAMDGIKLPNISRAMKEVQKAENEKKTSGSGESGTAENDSKEGLLERVQSALKSVSGIVSQGLPKAGAEVEKFSGAISELVSKGSGLKSTGANLLALAKAHPGYAALGTALTAAAGAVKVLVSSVKRLGSSAFTGLRKTFDALGNAARKLSAELVSLAKKGISGIANGLKSAGKFVVSDFIKPFTSAIKTVKTWKNALGRIAFYRAVRSAIKMVTDGFSTGIKNLYEYSKAVGTQFAPAMNSLATSAQYLKNSLGAMAAPLVQALAPAIDYLIDKFVALLNVIGKVFAALTGKSTFSQAWSKITDAIQTKWNEIVSKAVQWGKDVCKSISDGISAGIGWVRNAASSVASGISSYLHFSEPDVGPLSRFHTFMPDMLKLMAAGIRGNAGLAENAAYELADRVSAAINTASAGLEVPVSAYANVQTAAEYGSVYGERQADWEPGGENSREIVSAIYDTAGQLLGALNALADRPVEVDLDGKAVTRQVEKRQRERGAGILTGGVWT